MTYFDENVINIEKNESPEKFPLIFKYIGDEGNLRTDYLYHNPDYKWLKIFTEDSTEHVGYVCLSFNKRYDLSIGTNQSVHISILEILNKGNGYGTQVLRDIEDFAKFNNFKFITLQAKNDRVRDWYLKQGFYFSIDKTFLIKYVA